MLFEFINKQIDFNSASGFNPMTQFEVKPIIEYEIGGLDLSFTNSALLMLVAVGSIVMLSVFALDKPKIVPSRLQMIMEIAYHFVADIVKDSAGKQAMRYFPFIMTLFVFILFCNMLGMLPYSFTVTSHIIVTFIMALVVFIGVTIIGFAKNGVSYLKLFFPSGVPPVMYILLTPVEIISYLSRPISLSVRLFANMMAGHTLLKVFGSFVVSLGIVAGWLPLFFIVAVTGLEILVAFLQAYVFAVLTAIYLNDAINMHH